MRFKPKSEQEIQEMNCIPAGKYSFEVLDAEEKKSKSGNDMIELKLKLWDNHGRERVIKDWLLEAMAFKLRHFCNATDLLHEYEAGILADHHCIGRCGVLELIEQKDDNGYMRNAVKDYVKKHDSKTDKSEKKKKEEPDFSDDIPF